MKHYCTCQTAHKLSGAYFNYAHNTMYETDSDDGETCRYCGYYTSKNQFVWKQPGGSADRKRGRKLVGSYHMVDREQEEKGNVESLRAVLYAKLEEGCEAGVAASLQDYLQVVAPRTFAGEKRSEIKRKYNVKVGSETVEVFSAKEILKVLNVRHKDLYNGIRSGSMKFGAFTLEVI